MCVQKEGALQIAQPKGAPPLPPFERWSFRERRYIQWLADMHTAHYTLEAAIADAAVVAATEHYGVRLPSNAVECACRKASAASITVAGGWALRECAAECRLCKCCAARQEEVSRTLPTWRPPSPTQQSWLPLSTTVCAFPLRPWRARAKS